VKTVGLVGGHHSVFWYIDIFHPHNGFFAVHVVERRHKPEDARDDEECKKNQKFPVRFTEQEMSDSAEYAQAFQG
jgi:hypothetical protein